MLHQLEKDFYTAITTSITNNKISAKALANLWPELIKIQHKTSQCKKKNDEEAKIAAILIDKCADLLKLQNNPDKEFFLTHKINAYIQEYETTLHNKLNDLKQKFEAFIGECKKTNELSYPSQEGQDLNDILNNTNEANIEKLDEMLISIGDLILKMPGIQEENKKGINKVLASAVEVKKSFLSLLEALKLRGAEKETLQQLEKVEKTMSESIKLNIDAIKINESNPDAYILKEETIEYIINSNDSKKIDSNKIDPITKIANNSEKISSAINNILDANDKVIEIIQDTEISTNKESITPSENIPSTIEENILEEMPTITPPDIDLELAQKQIQPPNGSIILPLTENIPPTIEENILEEIPSLELLKQKPPSLPLQRIKPKLYPDPDEPPITLSLPDPMRKNLEKQQMPPTLNSLPPHIEKNIKYGNWLASEIMRIAFSNKKKNIHLNSNIDHLVERLFFINNALKKYQQTQEKILTDIMLKKLESTTKTFSAIIASCKPDAEFSLHDFNLIASFSDNIKIVDPKADIKVAIKELTDNKKTLNFAVHHENKNGGLSSLKNYFNSSTNNFDKRITINTLDEKEFIAVQEHSEDSAQILFKFNPKDIEALSIDKLVQLAAKQVEDFRCLVTPIISNDPKVTDSFDMLINILPGTHPRLASAIKYYCEEMGYNCKSSLPISPAIIKTDMLNANKDIATILQSVFLDHRHPLHHSKKEIEEFEANFQSSSIPKSTPSR